VDVYGALTSAGFSTVQAIGAMANAIAESSLDPEADVVDSNGARSYGLWQFNAASYPDAGKLVTGNPAADIIAQVGYLKSHVSGQALAGTTGAEVAGNFAANFERCQGCQAGGSAYSTRVGNASTVEGWISSGHWPASSAGISGGSGGGGGGTATLLAATPGCLVNLPVVGCLLDKSQARGIIGGLLLATGGILALAGLAVLVAAGFAGTGAGRAAGSAISAATPVGRAARLAAAPTRLDSAPEPPLEPAQPSRATPAPRSRPAPAGQRKVRAGGSQVSQDFYDRYLAGAG
jgi:hypothetical protein